MEALDERTAFVRGPVVLFRWVNAPGWPVEHVSPNVLEVFGYDADDLMSGRIAYVSLIHPEDVERVAREVSEASESRVSTFTHDPYRIHHRNGRTLWLQDVTRIARGPDGVPTQFIGYVIDVTERVLAQQKARQLERQLLEAQKLESLGVLAGGIAHDFNNLLTGILGHASLAKRLTCSECGDRTKESLEEIERLARGAARLTQQLLSYAGRGTRTRVPVDLREVVESAAKVLEGSTSPAASITFDLPDELPCVDADRAQMEQLVANLMMNAREAVEGRDGRISLRLRAELAAEQGISDVVLEIEDSGVGMSADVRERLFDPFFTTKQTGRGLGMSAVLGIVRSHHGSIEVHSVLDEGSLVRVRLPATDSRASVAARRRTRSGAPSRGAVLIIDDDASIRSSASALLQFLGYTPIAADGGWAGIESYEQHRDSVLVVLLDLTMPELSGRETFALLRERNPNLPIVISSGYSAEHDPVIEHASAFLQKPYGTEELSNVLISALRGGSSPGVLASEEHEPAPEPAPEPTVAGSGTCACSHGCDQSDVAQPGAESPSAQGSVPKTSR